MGLALDNDRDLHLYVGGIDRGVIGTDVLDPCNFMFDLRGYCTKVLCTSCYMQLVLYQHYITLLLLFVLLM